MSGRYEIEGILAQDERGIIFQAVDREGGGEVALRRFFPYGREGGGLEAAGQEAFVRSVVSLKAVAHPSLRKIVDGGCDPVDGMPFLVTEALAGKPLSEFAAGHAVETASVKAILEEAIDASLALSKVWGEEALWVECSAETVTIPESGRGLSFWVSPFRWTGGGRSDRGLLPLAELAERLLRWTGKPQSDAAGEGLGGWIRHIRTTPTGWNLRDARIFLREPVRGLPPLVAENGPPASGARRPPGAQTAPGVKPATPQPLRRRRAARWPLWVGGGVVALALGGFALWTTGAWARFVKHVKAEPPTVTQAKWQEPPPPKPAAERAPGAWDVAGKPDLPPRPAEQPTPPAAPSPVAAAPTPAAPVAGGAIAGKVIGAEESVSGQTLYLKVQTGSGIRYIGLYQSGGASAGDRQARDALVGKTIRVNGRVREEMKRGHVVNVDAWSEVEVQK